MHTGGAGKHRPHPARQDRHRRFTIDDMKHAAVPGKGDTDPRRRRSWLSFSRCSETRRTIENNLPRVRKFSGSVRPDSTRATTCAGGPVVHHLQRAEWMERERSLRDLAIADKKSR
jgi:hypothetical protein